MHVIGTAGHVDHGKSTLVQALTGIDPDRLAEEKERGLTIDLGFAWFPLPSGSEIGIVDVPGHERFIANMLAGAGGISVCLFVVAANEGWMPQSAEHLAIIDVLGVSHGVVALTKVDLVDADTVELVGAEVAVKLSGTSLEGAPIVPVSASTGVGLDALVSALDSVVAAAPAAVDLGRPRLWIDRVFTISGAGTVVTGTLAGGSFSVGESVQVSPGGGSARIRKIQSHKRSVEQIAPGNRTALNLAGLERFAVSRGDAVVRADRWRPTSRISALLRVLPSSVIGVSHELSEKGSHLLYVGSAEIPVRVKLLEGSALRDGESGLVQLYLRNHLPLARGDRFVLRDAGRVLTFGGGVVLDPLPPVVRRGEAEGISLLRSLISATGPIAVEAIVGAEGDVSLADIRLRADTDEIPSSVVHLGPRLFSVDRFSSLVSSAVEVLGSFHRDQPLAKGMDRAALRAEIGLDADTFDAFIERAPGVVVDRSIVRLETHSVALSAEETAVRDRLIATLEGAGYQPPLARELDIDARLLRSLTESGDIVKIGDFYLSGPQGAAARAQVRSFIEANGPMTVAQIRDLLGTSRKYAVPLSEWLDSTGATARHGDLRHLGPHP